MKILKCVNTKSSFLIKNEIYTTDEENDIMYIIRDKSLPTYHHGGYLKRRFEIIGEIAVDNKLFQLVNRS